MDEKTNISVIIPIFSANKSALKDAIVSVGQQKVKPDTVILVVAEGSDDHKLVKKLISPDFGLNFEILSHKEDTSFQNQLNLGVKHCKSEWFVFLEQDDELSKIWIDNVVKYRAENSEIQLFLPFVLDVSENTEKSPSEILGMTNDAVWAAEFSEVMGHLDVNSLLKYQNFNFDGMAMRKDIYEEMGGVKLNIKLTFMYEFLLRMTKHDIGVMVVPKLGYKHVNMRKGGFFSSLKDNMTPDEARWWLATAKREYFHLTDRELSYVNTTD